MPTITPHLWYDKEAREAAEFYTSVFPKSSITNVITLHDTPSGDCDIVSFKLWDYAFMAISVGPLFKFNPSISFMVNFDPSQHKDAKAHLDAVWSKLADGGYVLMPLDKYPFSEHYGWIQDRYGLSWQLILTNPEGEALPLIIPSLLFVGDVCGKAEEASDFYLSISGSQSAARSCATGRAWHRTKKARSCLLISNWKISGSSLWIARTGTSSPSMKRFPSWYLAIRKRKSTTTGGTLGGARSRAVRLAQRQIWRLLADYFDCNGRDDEQRHACRKSTA